MTHDITITGHRGELTVTVRLPWDNDELYVERSTCCGIMIGEDCRTLDGPEQIEPYLAALAEALRVASLIDPEALKERPAVLITPKMIAEGLERAKGELQRRMAEDIYRPF